MLKPSIIPWYPLSMRISFLSSVKSPRFIAVVSLVIAGREHPRAQLARHQRLGQRSQTPGADRWFYEARKEMKYKKKILRIRQLSKFPGCILIRKSKNPSLGVMKTVPYRKLRAVCRMCMCYIHIYIYTYTVIYIYIYTMLHYTICEIMLILILSEGSLEVKLPTIWADGKAEVRRVRKEKSRREKIREEKESEDRRCRCAKK